MQSLRQFTANVVYPTIGVFLAFLIMYGVVQAADYVPTLEGAVWPVVKFRGVADVTRVGHGAEFTTGRVCFTLTVTKVSPGRPLPYRFWASTPYSDGRMKLAPYLADKDDARAPDQSYGPPHPVGATWPRRYCAEMPGAISDADAVTIGGASRHMRHAIYATQTSIPAFFVPPVGAKR